MKMDDMNKYLEDRGFEVNRAYSSKGKFYNFVISKDEKLLSSDFRYPETRDGTIASRIQKEFLEGMIAKFNRIHGRTETKKSENTPDIYWRVESMTTTTSGGHIEPTIEVEVTGRVNNFSGTWDTECIRNRLEAAMNERNIFESNAMKIKDVIFNNPATIVFWIDGTKTVVKCQGGESYDPEKGLTMAISKKALGNKGNYYNEIMKWLNTYDAPAVYPNFAFNGWSSKHLSDLIDERIKRMRGLEEV